MLNILKRFIVTLPYTLPVFVASFTVIAVVFLVNDFFVSGWVWGVGIPISLVLAFIVYKYVAPHIELTKSNVIATSVVFVLCGAWFLGNAYYTSQHLYVDRDPAIYANTAAWLINHDNLHITSNEAIFDDEDVRSTGSGFGKSGENTVSAQGAHAFPALLGLAGRIVGLKDMLHVVPIFGAVGLFAFYGFLRLLLKKQRWAIAGVTLLSVSLPMLYFSRDAYTEPLALIFVFASLSILYFAHKTNAAPMWLVAGVTAGASALTRIDALLGLAGLIAAVFVAIIVATAKAKKPMLLGAFIFIITALVLFTLAYYDLSYLSPAYLKHHEHLLKAQMLVVGGLIAIGFMCSILSLHRGLLKKVATGYTKHKKKIAIGAAYVAGAVWLVLLSRPLWYVGRGVIDNPRVEDVQKTNGLMIDGWRTYAENSMEWLGWYIGVLTLVLAMVGLIIAIIKMVNSRNIIYFALVAVVGGASIIYINIPSITADQIWAARRFLPVIIPGLIALAMLTLALLESYKDKLPRWLHAHVTPALFGIFGVCLLAAAMTTAPFTTVRTYDNQLAQIEQVCDTLPENATLLLSGGYTFVAVQTFRSVCNDVTVGYLPVSEKLPNSKIKQINEAVRASGSELYIGALLVNIHALNDNGVERPFNISMAEEYESTLIRKPQATVPYDLGFYLGRVTKDGKVTAVNEEQVQD